MLLRIGQNEDIELISDFDEMEAVENHGKSDRSKLSRMDWGEYGR